MKTYCPMPFLHIFSDSTNEYDLCCHTASNEKESNYLRRTWNATEDLPFDFFNSEDMDAIRKKMLAGERIESCRYCYEMEESDVFSPRNYYFKKYGYLNKKDQVDIKLRIFGNYCNLSCYMCHPNHSTGRQRDLKDLGYNLKNFGFDRKIASFSKISYEEMEVHILNNLKDIRYISVLGGEPLQVKRFYEFMEKIPQEHAERIYIAVGTNLTEVTFKGHDIEDLLKKFPRLTINISAEHIGKKEEWIRWPKDFNKFKDNVEELLFFTKKYKRNRVRLTPTLSVLNLEDMNEIWDYYDKMNLVVGQATPQIVTYPRFLQPHLHNKAVEIAEKYDNTPFQFVSNHIRSKLKDPNESNKRELMRQHMFNYLDNLSTKRGDWRELWTQL